MRRSGRVWRGSRGGYLFFFFHRIELGLNGFRQRGYNQQALYCYRKVYILEPDNVDAIWDRATLALELGELRLVRAHEFLPLRCSH